MAVYACIMLCSHISQCIGSHAASHICMGVHVWHLWLYIAYTGRLGRGIGTVGLAGHRSSQMYACLSCPASLN